MNRTWTWTYPTHAAAETAARHHAWITAAGGVTIPQLLRQDGNTLVFTHVRGRHVMPADLVDVARALARFHITANKRLAGARMNAPFRNGCGTVINGFTEARRQRLLYLFAGPTPPDTWMSRADVTSALTQARDLPPAVYKDANVRNFLITPTIVTVDFDALTLAPFGYDLAKLVVSAMMAYGPPVADLIGSTRTEYNRLLTQADLPICTSDEFAAGTEMHHVLTSPYIGRNGYRFRWPNAAPL